MANEPTGADLFRLHHAHGYSPPQRASWMVERLLSGLEGRPARETQARVALAASLTRQSLVFNPLDPSLWSQHAALAPHAPPSPGFTAWAEAAARTLATAPAGPAPTQADLDRIDTLAGEGDGAGLATLAGQPGAALARFMALVQLWQMGEGERLLPLAERVLREPPLTLAAPFLAWAAYGAGQRDLAQALSEPPARTPGDTPANTLTRAQATLGPPNFLSLNLAAETALAAGDKDAARRLFLESLEFEPGQSFLFLRLRELGLPAPDPGLPGKSRTAVLFYTYNKLGLTLATLESLLASNIAGAAVAVLNNGSTAFSPEEFAAGIAATAAGRAVEVVQLPVNVGAPAARNWLWHLPSTREADYVAFLDDDVLLPRDWLAAFLEDLHAPPAGILGPASPAPAVVGPTVLNPGRPATVQYGSRFFLATGERLIRFTDNAPLVMDLGQYGFRRPCLSVMGCCHLFDRKRCEQLGVPDFDIRFTPSQVDDIEHDLQVWKAGGAVVHDGRVRVTHVRGSGPKGLQSLALQGQVWGNHLKMEHKFTAAELAKMDAATREADLGLLRAAVAEAEGALGAGGRDYYRLFLG
jgi:GT2 family glycosyltransferase